MRETRKVEEFFKSNPDKFTTRRQASKYLNGYGKVWKGEKNIDLFAGKRDGRITPPTQKSLKYVKRDEPKKARRKK